MGVTNFDLVKSNFFQGPTMASEIPASTGTVFWVNSVIGSDGNEGTSPASPLATTAAARAKCTANKGDVVVWMENHAETFSAAAGLVLSVAGVTYVTLGTGLDRATFSFGTATGASIDVTADDNRIIGYPIGLAAIDGLTKPFNITGNNFVGEIEWRDASSTVEAATAVRLDTADNHNLKLIFKGFIAGNANVRIVAVDDCDGGRIDVDYYGITTTAVVNFVDSLSTDIHVTGRMYTSGTTNFTKTVVDTIGSSIWSADFLDATANVRVSGGNVAALASDDVTALATAINTIDDILDTEFPVVVSVLGGVADATVADTVEGAAMTTQSLVSELKAVLQRIGADSANNTAATSLVVANSNGSLFERAEALQVAAGPSKDHPNYFTVTADMTSATWNTAAAHEIATVTGVCRLQILVETTATVITTGTNGTMALGYEGNTSAIFSATALDAALTGDVWTAVYGSAATTVVGGASGSSSLTHSIFDVVVVGGADVGYTIATNAATTGTLVFHVWWKPLSSTGAVTAGAGGAL